MLPRNLIEEMVSRVDNHKKITTDASGTHSTSLASYEQIVEVDSTLGVGDVLLPDVSEAAGKEYSITALTGNTNAVTVKEKATGNSFDWPSDASLNAANDRALYKSDGKRWYLIADQFT